MDPLLEYAELYGSCLCDIAENLQAHVHALLSEAGLEGVERVTARAKSPVSFSGKARLVLENGERRYSEPLTQIQDQLGTRVIVLSASSVDPVIEVVHRFLQPIEDIEKAPESDWEFGYFGRHTILALPGDVVPQGTPLAAAPPFFELQVKTLFQHAWSECNHELGYKPESPLSRAQTRLLAHAAAQAWGADRAFDELRRATPTN